MTKRITVKSRDAAHAKDGSPLPVSVVTSHGTKFLNIATAVAQIEKLDISSALKSHALGALGEVVAGKVLPGLAFPSGEQIVEIKPNQRGRGIDMIAITSDGDKIPIEVKTTNAESGSLPSLGEAGGFQQGSVDYNQHQADLELSKSATSTSQQEFQNAAAAIAADPKPSVFVVIHAKTSTIHYYTKNDGVAAKIEMLCVSEEG